MFAAVLLPLTGCAGSVPPHPAEATGEEMRWIPVTAADGRNEQMLARICRPAETYEGDVRVPVAIINHGSPADPADRASMVPAACGSEPARWFLARGYAVVFPMRRGFGASSGKVAESSGPCDSPDYVRAGLESARDVAAAVRYATALPYARPDGTVVVGQSLGGWATVAFAAEPHPQVAGLISMAGGRGGHAYADAGGNCRPDLLVAAAAAFGRTARTPMLWIYADNDSFFPPPLARAMYDAFTEAGGRAALAQPRFPGPDGHALFYAQGGSRVWGPLVAAYLADMQRGAPL
jgi:pimeloyl-ACP methyl ester carboxylesterase